MDRTPITTVDGQLTPSVFGRYATSVTHKTFVHATTLWSVQVTAPGRPLAEDYVQHALTSGRSSNCDKPVFLWLATQDGQRLSRNQVVNRLHLSYHISWLLANRSAYLLLARVTLLGDDQIARLACWR